MCAFLVVDEPEIAVVPFVCLKAVQEGFSTKARPCVSHVAVRQVCAPKLGLAPERSVELGAEFEGEDGDGQETSELLFFVSFLCVFLWGGEGEDGEGLETKNSVCPRRVGRLNGNGCSESHFRSSGLAQQKATQPFWAAQIPR